MIFQQGGIEPITACAIGACSAAAPVVTGLVAPVLATIGIGSAGVALHKRNSNKKSNKKSTKKKGGKKKGGKSTRKKSKKKSYRGGKFKKNELVTLKKNGKNKNMIFVRSINGKTTLRFPGKKGPGKTIIVDDNKPKKISKTIGSTKKRQKNKRAKKIRKKRGLATNTTTEELPDNFSPTYNPRSPPFTKKSDNIENLFDSMKLK